MGLKATLAIFMAMILVAVSCAGSACTLKCELRTSSPHCHRAADLQEHTMAGMGHQASPSSAPHLEFELGMGAPCKAHVCDERFTSAASARMFSGTRPDFVQQLMVVNLLAWPTVKDLPNWLSDPPPLRESSLVSLHTVLRV